MIYAVPTAVGRNDSTMQRAISLFAHFMKKRPKKRAASVTTQPTTSAPPTTTPSSTAP